MIRVPQRDEVIVSGVQPRQKHSHIICLAPRVHKEHSLHAKNRGVRFWSESFPAFCPLNVPVTHKAVVLVELQKLKRDLSTY